MLCVGSSVSSAWSRRLLVIYSVQQSSGFACFQPSYRPPRCAGSVFSPCPHIRGITTETPPPPYTGLMLSVASMTAGLFLTVQALWVTSRRPHDHWEWTKRRSCPLILLKSKLSLSHEANYLFDFDPLSISTPVASLILGLKKQTHLHYSSTFVNVRNLFHAVSLYQVFFFFGVFPSEHFIQEPESKNWSHFLKRTAGELQRNDRANWIGFDKILGFIRK